MGSLISNSQLQEWLDAFGDIRQLEGVDAANELMERMSAHAQEQGCSLSGSVQTPYLNSISQDTQLLEEQELAYLKRIGEYLRWNAASIVLRACRKSAELGGHIGTAASIMELYLTGKLFFFNGPQSSCGGDIIFFQGHASPANYALAFLEGRFGEKELSRFRQEIGEAGLSSYPHPWLMPDFWQFPTVSMGLGPFMAVFQAHIMKYLENRGLIERSNRKVWAFCGDGEMIGEPESVGALPLAGREKLDNLIFVVSCNLQRLDGPVVPYAQVIQVLEGIFLGAGWRVIKLIWGGGWDELFAQDSEGVLKKRISQLSDGEYQNYSAKGPAYMREHFFGSDPVLSAMIDGWSDDKLGSLLDGGHDFQKIYSAFKAAVETQGQPVAILAKTVKGFGLGTSQAANDIHNKKKMTDEEVATFARYLGFDLNERQIKNLDFLLPERGQDFMQFFDQRREVMGGDLPFRKVNSPALKAPDLSAFESLLNGTGERKISTTMAFGRVLAALLKDKQLKSHVVPIVADETRTFGMEGLFRQIGIYSPFGQPYQPVDHEQLMYYREATDGQMLQEGLSEANAIASWIAVASSYVNYGVPLIPFYEYYSMFGYQRIGDFVWAAADMRCRGFLMGGTAGRTTLAGEGLQHQDGHNLLMFSYVPNCQSYDPVYAYELAVIVRHGIERMFEQGHDEFYYITMMNENYHHPKMPEGVEADIVKGLYCFQSDPQPASAHVELIGGGAIFNEVLNAAGILKRHGISSNIWSATSFNQLRRDIESVNRERLYHPEVKRKSHVEQCFENCSHPIIAATDYIKQYAQQVSDHMPKHYHCLGTDGFGRSDTRENLRAFFEVNAASIAFTAASALLKSGDITKDQWLSIQKDCKINLDKPSPITQ